MAQLNDLVMTTQMVILSEMYVQYKNKCKSEFRFTTTELIWDMGI